MKQGYRKVIDQDRLEIFKDDILVATGRYNPPVGLIQMDSEIVPKSKSLACTLNEWHCRLGHISESLLKRTLNQYSIPYQGTLEHCEAC